MADEFTCAQCGGTFEKAWSDEEALAEAAELWTPEELEDQAVICDDCFVAMTTELPIETWRASNA